MSRPRGPDGQFLPWPLDENGNPKRESLAAKDPIAVAHREEKPYGRDAKEKRRKVPREESGTRDPATGQLQGGIPGHAGSFGRIPNDIRQELINSAGEYIGVLREIAADGNAPRTERMKAIELCLRYGPGPVSQHEVHHSGLLGFVGVIERLPAESLKRLEAMDDKQLEQTLGFLLGNGQQEAAHQLVAKIKALQAAQEHEPPAKPARLPKPRPLDPKHEVKPEIKPERDPEADHDVL